MNNPTAEYSAFEQAYDHFNADLFEGRLPLCLITLQRKSGAYGYFSPERFISRGNGNEKTDEIAMNPEAFEWRTDAQILSTLVHEMVHLWHEHFDIPPRKSYHNKVWANKMESIGLMPSTTGQPGGKRVGQKVSHYVIEGGGFELSCSALLATGFKLNWQSYSEVKKETTKSKVKYSCSECEQNAWAKPNASLVCGVCMIPMDTEEE